MSCSTVPWMMEKVTNVATISQSIWRLFGLKNFPSTSLSIVLLYNTVYLKQLRSFLGITFRYSAYLKTTKLFLGTREKRPVSSQKQPHLCIKWFIDHSLRIKRCPIFFWTKIGYSGYSELAKVFLFFPLLYPLDFLYMDHGLATRTRSYIQSSIILAPFFFGWIIRHYNSCHALDEVEKYFNILTNDALTFSNPGGKSVMWWA